MSLKFVSAEVDVCRVLFKCCLVAECHRIDASSIYDGSSEHDRVPHRVLDVYNFFLSSPASPEGR